MIVEPYRIVLEEACNLPGFEDTTWAEAIALGIARKAAQGHVSGAKEMREATEDKAVEKHELTDKFPVPLVAPPVTVRYIKWPRHEDE